MTALPDKITITELAKRSGVATSALRYYEELGLITPTRTAGNQRRYPRSALRRVAVIKVAQAVGISLREIRTAFSSLPDGRDPTPSDWEHLSSQWRDDIAERIETLGRLRDQLSFCIGCGCLSLDRCSLVNQGDQASAKGPGARYLLGDVPDEP